MSFLPFVIAAGPPQGSTSANSFLSYDRHAPRAPAASPTPSGQPVIIHLVVGSRFTVAPTNPSPTKLLSCAEACNSHHLLAPRLNTKRYAQFGS